MEGVGSGIGIRIVEHYRMERGKEWSENPSFIWPHDALTVYGVLAVCLIMFAYFVQMSNWQGLISLSSGDCIYGEGGGRGEGEADQFSAIKCKLLQNEQNDCRNCAITEMQ